jgi:integrase
MPSVLLTDLTLRSLAPSEKLIEFWDKRVPGLCLRASPGGIRTWTFRYRPKGSTSFKRLGLGRYPEVGLALARARAEEKRVDVAGGGDPQGERATKRAAERQGLTFDALADEYLERYARQHKASWKNDQLYLRAHVRPSWADRKAKSISRAAAAALLDGIASRSPSSANHTQSILSKLFNWAVESGLLDANPVAGLRKRARETPKDRTLSPDEIRVLWGAIGEGPISATVAEALRFVLLTGLRPGEVAGAAISELADVECAARARLEIPAARMKGRRPHVTPMAPMALAIVWEQLSRATVGQEYVFPSAFADRGPIARHSLSQGLKRVIVGLQPTGADAGAVKSLKGNPPTPHDLRRTCATGLAALGIAREDRLAILAHAQGDVHAAHYDRYDRLAEKRRALELWEARVAEIIEPPEAPGNVAKISGRR